jgi:hypothetical protein
LGAQALGSDKGDAQESGGKATDTTVADATPTTDAPSGTTEPPAPACESDSGRCASISGIRISGDHYVADYTVTDFDPLTRENGGTADDHHVHFFFDTTSPEDAGANSASPGQWVVWDRVDAGGALSFDEAKVADAEGNAASQLCVLVADASHGVEQGTGNCVDLPT